MNKNSKNNSKENQNTNIIATGIVTVGNEGLNKGTEEAANKTAEATKEPKKDAAEKGAANGEKTLEQIQRELKAKIKQIEDQKEAARKREIFIKTQEELKELKNTLLKTKEFETDFCKLRLEKLASVGYNTEFKPMFTISNSEILTEFCEWLDEKIVNKVHELEAELLK